MTIIDCICRANGRPTLRYGRLLQGLIARDLVGACYPVQASQSASTGLKRILNGTYSNSLSFKRGQGCQDDLGTYRST